ncbi:MAG: phospholipid/cholesterol/gamma-HCH transport system substrate-binding protein [Thermoleophilaceae bacterium]|nr:phospholipid/cholesterol/gamma-HCH transport system substrate-binding protein [Thermoleophilaceae bacterium]
MRLPWRNRPARAIDPEKRGWRSGMAPVKAGAIAIVVLLLLFYIAYAGGLPIKLPGISKPEIQIQVASGQGLLLKRSTLRVGGVDVGQVAAIDRGPAGTAVITGELGGNAPTIHTDARAKIRPRTFLEGNYFIEVVPGSPSAPVMPDGGMIPIARTTTPVQFDQVVGAFTKDTRTQLKTGVRQLGNAYGPDAIDSFNGSLEHIAPGFRDLATTAQAFRGTQPGDLSDSIRSVARTNAAIGSDLPALDSLVSSFATVAAALADQQGALESTFRELDGVVRASRPSLAAVDSAIPETEGLIRAVRPVLRETPPTVNRATPFVRQANRLLKPGRLPELARTLGPPLRELTAFAPTSRRIFQELDPTLQCVNDAVVPTLFKKIDDGVLSSNEPVYRELIAALVGLNSASQNFDGNGYETRFHAGVGDQIVSANTKSPLETLFGSVDSPIMGSTPELPPDQPPYLPKRSCVGTEAPDLASKVGPTGMDMSTKGSTTLGNKTLDQSQLKSRFAELQNELRDLKGVTDLGKLTGADR